MDESKRTPVSVPPVAIADARSLLRKYDLWPRKSLGQNFLVHPSAPDRIAECARLSPDDTVLEVGAGLGTLTAALASRAGRVVAVETDAHLVDVLQAELGNVERIDIVHGDILELDPSQLLGVVPSGSDAHPALWGPRLPHYRVVANLPYYITNAVVRHLLEASVRPMQMVVTVQLEVAQRMVAGPGDMSLLAVSVQFYGVPKICFKLKRGAFHPAPSVVSAVVRLDLHDEMPVAVEDVALFFRVVKAGFSQRRKQLRNSLSTGLALAPNAVSSAMGATVDPRRRAETLSIREWGDICAALRPLLS
ncbi:MAG: 16S rRNA (adenine(1518)-N(6)/adenine(1519)-N(6))-dimethyltransferase RsmA [Anaerolineae bacterium]|nr:16S rRNA (adenine(1518)-N(6)/adenine(1519)-N(6))-dimethyltransferase RsmA [Anaerolineae bacterium]